MRVETIGDAILYLGDCREILPGLAVCPECEGDGFVVPMGAPDRVCGTCNCGKKLPIDTVLTDPPYGVGVDYGRFIDTPDNVATLVADIVPQLLKMSARTVLTCATRQIGYYPPPTWILCWLNRAGMYPNPWGFTCWQPVLVYGPDPFLKNKKGSRPDVIEHSESADVNGHPCPKPDKFWLKLLHRCTAETDHVILDPFMGSGTTGVACANLGRKFIGIEIEPKYFDIACERISAAYAQLRLFA